MNLFFKFLSIHVRCSLEYRKSFILLSISGLISTLFAFVGVSLLFYKFGTIKGWSYFEVALCYGIAHISFVMSEMFGRGFDSFSGLVKAGEFDRLLTRPRNTALQVACSNVDISKAGRMVPAVVIFAAALLNLNIQWDFFKVITVIFMVLGGVSIFTGIFVLAATYSFYSVEGIELMNIFSDGGRETVQYPINIYKKWFARFFTFVIPFGCINYYPLLYLLGKGGISRVGGVLSPLSGIVFLIPCFILWNIGVRHYKSTGS